MNPSIEYDRRRKAFRDGEVLAQIAADRHTPDAWFLANRSRPAALRRLAERGQIVFSADGWYVPEPRKPSLWQRIRVLFIGEQHE
jgi:hypothetical protein